MLKKNICKIPNDRIKLLFTAFGVAGISYVGLKYYNNITRDDTKSRIYQIPHRDKDVESIRKRLTLKPDEIKNKFSVLTNPSVIGKTVAIETADKNLKGINSSFPDKSKTRREFTIKLEPMTLDMMLCQLREFKDLFILLENQGNEEVVLDICGDVSLLLKQFNDKIEYT